MLFLFWILLVVGPAGGYICAMLARRQYLAHGIALSLLALVIYALEVVNTPAGDKVTMFVVGTFLTIPIGIMSGAYLYSRSVSHQDRGISRTAGSAG
jgi:hypothetical protein